MLAAADVRADRVPCRSEPRIEEDVAHRPEGGGLNDGATRLAESIRVEKPLEVPRECFDPLGGTTLYGDRRADGCPVERPGSQPARTADEGGDGQG